MSWFQSTNLASFAKTAFKEAQKTIDKALDINETEQDGTHGTSASADRVAAVTEAATDFFASWGVAVGAKKKGAAETDSLNSPRPNSSNSNSSTPRRQSIDRSITTTTETGYDGTNQNSSSSTLKNPNKISSQQHKRSSSLETCQISTTIPSVMHKSLTSDIPVTLIAPHSELRTEGIVPSSSSSSNSTEEHNENAHSHTHTRSLSDTIFNSSNVLDDFEGAVQVLDEPDGVSFDNHHNHTIIQQPKAGHFSKERNESSASTSVSVSAKDVNETLKKQPELVESTFKVESTVSKEINVIPAAAPAQFQEFVLASDCISGDGNSVTNVDLLSTIDFSGVSLNNSDCSLSAVDKPDISQIPELLLMPSFVETEEAFYFPPPEAKIEDKLYVEESEPQNNSLIIVSEQDALCDKLHKNNNDDNTWSWTENDEPESSGFVEDTQSETQQDFTELVDFIPKEQEEIQQQQEQTTITSNSSRSKKSKKLKMSAINVQPWATMQQERIESGSAGLNAGDWNTTTTNEKIASIFDSGFEIDSTSSYPPNPNLNENVNSVTLPTSAAEEEVIQDVEIRSNVGSPHPELQTVPSTEENDEDLGDIQETKTSSPPASSISVVDSPLSASPINPSESQRDSPDNFEILSSSVLSGTSSSNCNEKHANNPAASQHAELPLSTIPATVPFSSDSVRSSGSQVDSSRSSSIVVVSTGNSTPSSHRGGGSTGSSAGSDGHHDIEDNSHGSPSFERVDPPSQSDIDAEGAITSGSAGGGVSSPQFIKGKHTKGASSASSSDIEVIPSDYQTTTTNNTSTVSIATKETSSTEQQTFSIPVQEVETQTDFPDEAKVLAEELPKKLTLEISEMLSEKDQMIDQLREEGEKLSKKQFDLSQMVKKLRGKEKDMENTIKELKGELAGKKLENERLMKSFVNKEGVEQTLNDTLGKLNLEKRTLELKVEQMKSELEDAKENCASMKGSVEDASVEILELQNAISSFQRDSAELDSLTRDKSELISRNDSLHKEVEQLRISINSTQSKASSRESELQSQIGTLTRKVHLLEDQLSDVSSEVADATMPLSLEIEKLQMELKTNQLQYEKRESVLQSLVAELELKLKSASDRERSYKELNLSLQTSVSNLEVRAHELEIENKAFRKQTSLQMENEGKEIEAKNAQISKLTAQVGRLTEEVERLSKENDLLGMELKSEKCGVEQERKRSQSLMDQLNSNSSGRNQFNNQQQSHTRTNSMSGNGNLIGGNGNNLSNLKSGENSPSSHSIISEVSYLDEVFDSNGHLVNNHRSLTPKSFFDSFSSVGMIENLQTQLRQRETEVMQFQEEVSKNEKIRKSLNEEIAKLTMQNQEFQMEMERLAELKAQLDEMEKNYNALLQMYGEKVEETDELRLDLQDVKDMYKTQIEQLLKR